MISPLYVSQREVTDWVWNPAIFGTYFCSKKGWLSDSYFDCIIPFVKINLIFILDLWWFHTFMGLKSCHFWNLFLPIKLCPTEQRERIDFDFWTTIESKQLLILGFRLYHIVLVYSITTSILGEGGLFWVWVVQIGWILNSFTQKTPTFIIKKIWNKCSLRALFWDDLKKN